MRHDIKGCRFPAACREYIVHFTDMLFSNAKINHKSCGQILRPKKVLESTSFDRHMNPVHLFYAYETCKLVICIRNLYTCSMYNKPVNLFYV